MKIYVRDHLTNNYDTMIIYSILWNVYGDTLLFHKFGLSDSTFRYKWDVLVA